MLSLSLGLGLSSSRGPSNVAPTDIAWSGVHAVDEDASLGTVVGGVLSATDPEGGAVTFSLSDDAGGRFAIGGDGTSIIVAGVLDYEAATSHAITIRATDDGGQTYDEAFTVTVSDVEEQAPENPLPPDGETVVDVPDNFEVEPVATVVSEGVKLHGKKAANGQQGKFVYTVGAFEVGTRIVVNYSADLSLLSNLGKNAAFGFNMKDGNSFHFVGLRGDGNTGIHKVKISGASPSGWQQTSGHTISDGGAAANGAQSGAWIALDLLDDGTYNFLTSVDGETWDTEYSEQTASPLSAATGNETEGLAGIFAGTDTGPFVFNVLSYLVEPLFTERQFMTLGGFIDSRSARQWMATGTYINEV